MITLQTSAVPLIQFNSTGLVIPTQAQILAGVQADWIAVFGANLNLNPATPQGQLMALQTEQISAVYGMVAWIANQIDPAQAMYFMQDALGQIYQQTRLPATFTSVEATLLGEAGLTINAGYQAQNAATNDVYTLIAPVTLDGTGTGTGTFQCTVSGPIVCPPGALSMGQSYPGLTSVSNTAAGITGSNVESREAFEIRRLNTLAANSQGFPGSVQSAIYQIPNVASVCVRVNNSSLPITLGPTNYPLPANAMYVGVAGSASPAAIGAAMNLKMAPGTPMAGGIDFVGIGSQVAGSNTVSISQTQWGAIQVGDTLSGAGIPTATKVTAINSMTGGVGSIQVSTNTGFASTAIYSYTGSSANGTNGLTQVQVTDPVSGQTSTYIYNVPNNVPVFYQVSIQNTLTVPSNIQSLIPTAIVATQLPGQANTSPYGIGAEIIAFQMAPAISNLGGVSIPVLSINVSKADFSGTAAQDAGTNTVTISKTLWGTIQVGDTLFGQGVPAGTTVTALGQGSVTVSTNTGFASTNIYSYPAFAPSVTMGIDEMPVFDTSYVTVNV